MNKITIEMQKVVIVRKIVFFILLLVVQTSVFSQKKLDGTYGYLDGTGEFWRLLEFSKVNVFSYKSGKDVGVSEYGQGHYILTKDSLILNFDLTELKEKGYYIAKQYHNKKEKEVDINLRIFNYDKKALENLQVLVVNDTLTHNMKTGETNKEGKVQFSFEKQDKNMIFVFIYEDSTYAPYLPIYDSFDIDIFLSGHSDYKGIPIKNTIQKYKIIKMKKDEFELQQPNGSTLKLKKIPPNTYDPFK